MQIELLKTHTHAGIACAPGALLSLDTDLAQWLVDQGVARNVPITSAESTPKSQSRTTEEKFK